MRIASMKALEVLDRHGLSDFNPDFQQISTLLDNEKILFNTYPFRGRLKERYLCSEDGIAQISIINNCTIYEQKHLIAHALGHHFLHKGNYAYIDGIVEDKQEFQAEVFAAVFLVPPNEYARIHSSFSFELAEECEIPLQLAEKRLQIYEQIGI